MQINMDRCRRPGQIIYVTDLIDHYFLTELSEDNPHHSLTTRMVHRDFIEKWIRPYWGKMPLECVRTMAVEHWLRRLQRADNKPLANGTKAKIRSLLSTLFNHGIRYEWLGQGRNPVKMVRQSTKRKKAPALLEVDQIKSLLSQLKERYRLMVLPDLTTGLRRSELFGLRWGDIDFTQLVIDIQRSVDRGCIGPCKTEASRKPIPLDLDVAAVSGSGRKLLNTVEETTGFSPALELTANTHSRPKPFSKR